MELVRERRIDPLLKKDVPGEVDRTVQRELNARLRQFLFHAAPAVSCEFHEGVVVLRGRVCSFYEKQLAQELARTTDGVRTVVNRLLVDSFVAEKIAGEVLPLDLRHRQQPIGAE